jgi:hypothetical protein
MKNRSEKQEPMDINSLSIIELKQLLSRVNQDINNIKRANRTAKKIAANNTVSELAECNIIAKRFTKTVIIENIENKKIKQDIQIQKDILDFINNGGRIITAKTRNKVKCQTFRNNKYSIFNKGHQASITGKYNFFASPNKVSL